MMVIRLQKIGALVLALLGALGGSVLLPAAARAFTIDQGTLHFGNVAINTTATLSNGVSIDSGFSYLGAGGISGLNPPFHFSSGTCTSSSTGSCTVEQSFTPTALGGFGGSITISECMIGGGSCSSATYDMDGTGVSVFGASDLDFGEVLLHTTVTLHVDLTIDAGFSYLGAGGISGLNPPFHFSSTCTSASIGTCTFDESFTPTATGDFGGFLTLSECSVGGGFCLNTEVNFTGKGVDRIVGAVDEPSAAALLVLGLAALRRRRRGRRA